MINAVIILINYLCQVIYYIYFYLIEKIVIILLIVVTNIIINWNHKKKVLMYLGFKIRFLLKILYNVLSIQTQWDLPGSLKHKFNAFKVMVCFSI